MGGCVSIQVSCDKILDRVGSRFCGRDNYICYLEKNLQALERAMEDLRATRDTVLRRVELAERQGQQRLQTVQVWLTRVETIETRFNDLYSARTVELQRLCCCGVCSKRLRLTYIYGRSIFEMLHDVDELEDGGNFQVVAMERPPQPTFLGRMRSLAWNQLMNVGTRIMGFYGMGGVGKTTLLTHIFNMFSDTNYEVDLRIWVEVSRNKHVKDIQDEIAEKLGLTGEEWNKKSQGQKAEGIHTFLRNKRFVLFLDNIWSKVDLEEIGVPYPTMENKCKVAFTTRSLDVCGQMGADAKMEVTCLEPNEAWEMFKHKVGEKTLASHPNILELANEVARKCCGLPLALTVIGQTMASKRTVEEWSHALDILTSSATDFTGMDDLILPILKYSYDSLKGDQIKSCFLYCSLFPQDYLIRKERLIDYWIGEGFIDEKEGRERALNQGYETIDTLVRACLLLESEWDKEQVRMHDMVREMALWISSDLGNYKERCIVQGGPALRKIPKVKSWKNVSRMSLMDSEIEEIYGSHECDQLTTLILHRNLKLVHISGEFFQYMPNIVVLDLSWNDVLEELPNEISKLVSLRFLDLSRTKIKQLPGGLQQLRKLIHLNLEWTLELESISGIYNLWSLRILRMQNSKNPLDVYLVNELELLENLEVLTIEIKSSLVAHKFLSCERLVQCTKDVFFRHIDELLTLPTIAGLSGITFTDYNMQEIKIVRTPSPWNKSPASACFSSLCSVVISSCDYLKDLTWLLFAPNLTNLDVSFSDRIEDIISEKKALSIVRDDDEAVSIIPFRKLEKLHLWNLPMLKSIYWSALPFPCLREIDTNKCPNLKKLALDSQSVVKVEELGITYRQKEWIENVEWEDEATQHRFLPYCKLGSLS